MQQHQQQHCVLNRIDFVAGGTREQIGSDEWEMDSAAIQLYGALQRLEGAPVPRFKRRGLKRRTARALHGRPMGRGPATVLFFADFYFLYLFCISKFK
jgi:hypothetical protein